MTCTLLTNDKNEVVGFACGSSWGMGISYFPDETDPEYQDIYGFAMAKDPHDFSPDYECNTAAEIAAWEKAKAECQCGREPETLPERESQDSAQK